VLVPQTRLPLQTDLTDCILTVTSLQLLGMEESNPQHEADVVEFCNVTGLPAQLVRS